jgi:VIT1/CCC1 family predicted Fe2+/Mn2+ transporter
MKNDTITIITSIIASLIFLGICGAIISLNWQKDTLKTVLGIISLLGFGLIFGIYLLRLLDKQAK